MVSLCGSQRDLRLAFELLDSMRRRGIARNVHTYSALMNVCIKCGQYSRALEVFQDMLKEGCKPNVVTYNTLIDVYGKNGQWAEALQVRLHGGSDYLNGWIIATSIRCNKGSCIPSSAQTVLLKTIDHCVYLG
jgi:pentatricopeptide repeat protein